MCFTPRIKHSRVNITGTTTKTTPRAGFTNNRYASLVTVSGFVSGELYLGICSVQSPAGYITYYTKTGAGEKASKRDRHTVDNFRNEDGYDNTLSSS